MSHMPSEAMAHCVEDCAFSDGTSTTAVMVRSVTSISNVLGNTRRHFHVGHPGILHEVFLDAGRIDAQKRGAGIDAGKLLHVGGRKVLYTFDRHAFDSEQA